MAIQTLTIDPAMPSIEEGLLARHLDRKHGRTATYGQRPGGRP